jgi:hypothetical protein
VNRGFITFDPNSDFMIGGLNQVDTLTFTLIGCYPGGNIKKIYILHSMNIGIRL